MHMKGEKTGEGTYFLLQDLMLYTFPRPIFHEREQSNNTIVECPHGSFNLDTHCSRRKDEMSYLLSKKLVVPLICYLI